MEISESATLTELSLSDNYLSGFQSIATPSFTTCDISKNFLACPITSWVQNVCKGVCGQVIINNGMNVTREVQRAASSSSSQLLLYFIAGYYGANVVANFVAVSGQSVEFSVYGSGNVIVDGKSVISFNGGDGITVRGFVFNGTSSVPLLIVGTASVSIYDSVFTRNR